MKKIFTLYFALLTISAFCQNHEDATTNKSDSVINYYVIEDKPEFPGGQDKMMEFISNNIKYPEKAKIDSITGKVFLSFVVKKDGSIGDVQVIRGVHPLLDAEAARVIKMMPNWKPGKQRGKNVNVKFLIPINFKLSGNK